MKKQVILIIIAGMILNCKSNNLEPNNEKSAIDITDAIFIETANNCATFAEDYESIVTDIKRNSRFNGSVEIKALDTTCQFSVNGIPNHDFNDESASFANNVQENERIFSLSQNPQIASTPTALSQTYYDAIMLNGVVVDMLSAGCYRPNDNMADTDGNVPIGCNVRDPWLVDPLGSDSKFGADQNNAHTQPDGTYHYHGNPNAMFDENPGSNGSPVIGFAADGFPIYGSYFLDPISNKVRKAVSGYELIEGSRPGPDESNPGGVYNGLYVDDYEFTNVGDLDECNGMTVNGNYGYYVTDAYPWILACHSGTLDETFGKGVGMKVTTAAWQHSH